MAIHLFALCVEQDCGKKLIAGCLLSYFPLTFPFHSFPQIKFENRKRGDIGNDCLLPLDGTDFWIGMGYTKSFWLYKFKKSALRYKVGYASKREISAGRLVPIPQGCGITI